MDRSLKLIAYLEGDLSAEEMKALEEQLRQDAELREELKKLEGLYQHIDDDPDVEVPESLHDDWEQLLASERRKQNQKQLWLTWTGRAAAAIALIAVGVWLGRSVGIEKPDSDAQLAELREEIQTNRELLLQSLQQPSASKRFVGINASDNIKSPDTEVIDALVQVMNTDDNTNVRIAAVRALARYSEDDAIRKSLIDAVVTQSDPLVQVVLIDVLVETGDKRLVPTLERLIQSDTTMDAVKDEAQWGVMKLS